MGYKPTMNFGLRLKIIELARAKERGSEGGGGERRDMSQVLFVLRDLGNKRPRILAHVSLVGFCLVRRRAEDAYNAARTEAQPPVFVLQRCRHERARQIRQLRHLCCNVRYAFRGVHNCEWRAGPFCRSGGGGCRVGGGGSLDRQLCRGFSEVAERFKGSDGGDAHLRVGVKEL
jgi:hypothetical protein